MITNVYNHVLFIAPCSASLMPKFKDVSCRNNCCAFAGQETDFLAGSIHLRYLDFHDGYEHKESSSRGSDLAK